MSSVVSGTVGYNFYLDGVKVNDALVPVDGSFAFEGLASNTDYSITSTSVDASGNESIPSVAVVGSTSQTVHVDSPLSAPDMAAVDAIVAASMVESSQPGVIVSITGPRGYYSKAYGNTAATGGRPLTIDDHFRMGSVTKTFTATAFWMQVDQGLVSLDDTLDMYVSGVPSGNLITIRDMMQMRSGVFDYQSDLMVQIIFSIFPTYTFSEAGALGIIRGNASQFTPGTSYAYTNSNYVLLGAVVEAVTGRKIKDILTEDILVPLGLTETQWPSSSAIPVPAASAGAVNPELFGAAGALTTTVGDLAKWAQAMRDGTLISDSSRSLWLETGFYGYPSGMSDPPPALFGYGMGMISVGTWLGHDGSVPGFSTACVFDSVSGATIAVSENAQTTAPVVLAAWTRIFHSIGAYLYPDSMADQVYAGAGVLVRPTGASLSISRGSPTVSVTALGVKVPTGASLAITTGTPTVSLSDNKLVTPTGVVLKLFGGAPGLVPTPASLTVTGGTPDVTIASFTPFTEENLNRINRPVPAGAAQWRYRAFGAGGGGGGPRSAAASTARTGGGGGGGGAYVDTGWQSVGLLGSTYSVTRGDGGSGGAPGASTTSDGVAGVAGGNSSFVSGSVAVAANGGAGGTGGPLGNAPGGAGGTTSISGVTASTTSNGTAGGQAAFSVVNQTAGGNNSTGGGAGGGGGGGRAVNNSTLPGSAGGNTTTGTGAAAGAQTAATPGVSATDQSLGSPGPGGGGGSGNSGSTQNAGGAGADWGGGGGGASGGVRNAAISGGVGGDGYTLIEWT